MRFAAQIFKFCRQQMGKWVPFAVPLGRFGVTADKRFFLVFAGIRGDKRGSGLCR